MAAFRIIPAIMSGGSGTRLWPMSTAARPKQFHALGAKAPMIVETAARVSGVHGGVTFAPPVVICNGAHADLACNQMREADLPTGLAILEPVGRNTAATAVLAALAAQESDPDSLVLLLPADHLIADPQGFRDIIAAAAPFARNRIVTFGIEPTFPSTGYGYIRANTELGSGVFEIAAFKEKPDQETARDYLRTGGYTWNAGIFLFHPSVLLDECAALAPDILEATQEAFKKGERADDRLILHLNHFEAVRSAPIDIAIMEKTRRGAVAPCRIGWTDVGSWAELHEVLPKDDNKNAVLGEANLVDVRGALVWRSNVAPKIYALGLENLVIAASAEAVIILPLDRAQDVKSLWALAQAKPEN